MALIRLELHEHPAAPQHEMRQKSVLDSGGTVVGTVANLYVDEHSRRLRFFDVLTSDFLGLERKHHLIPVEVVTDQDPGSITLGAERKTSQSKNTARKDGSSQDVVNDALTTSEEQIAPCLRALVMSIHKTLAPKETITSTAIVSRWSLMGALSVSWSSSAGGVGG